MPYLLTPYSGILFVTVAISAVVTFLALRRRAAYGASTFILLMLAITWYTLVAALEAAAVAQPAKIFWSKLEYIGSQSSVALFTIFAIQYTGQDRWLTPRNLVLLWILPILSFAMAATNERHGLVWSGFASGPSGSNLLIYHHGPYFWFANAYMYVYLAVAAWSFIRLALRSPSMYRRQAIALLAGSAIPWIGAIIYVLDLNPLPGLNIVPTSFALTGLVAWGSIARLQLLDLVPVARHVLIETMSDGVLVLDARDRVVDINPAMRSLLGQPPARVGQTVEQALARWPDLVRLCRDEGSSHAEVHLDQKLPRYVDFRAFPLQDRWGRSTGRLVILRDVTARHQAETQLKEANELLQARLEEIGALQDKLREEAIRDVLTGLFNRRYLQETLPRELSRAAREGQPVVLAMMDIDHFKSLNDAFGHKAGDLVLHALGELLRARTRRDDIACRYGGEEFVLVFPGLSLEHARRRVDGLRLSVRALRVEYEGQQLSATVSAGVAAFPTHGETSEDLLQAVDRALYMAKAAGRDCVKCLPVPPEAHTGSMKISSPTIPG